MADDFDSFRDDITDTERDLHRIRDLGNDVGRSISTALRGALGEGKSVRNLLGDIAKSFSDMALKAAVQPFGNLIGGLVQDLFKATNPAVTPFAKGGVIASPGYFPMGGGLGLAGEAGPEAIMPLQRGADGRLGVSGGGGGINVTFNVTASDARSFMSSEADVSAMLLRAVKRGTRAS